MNFQDMIIWFDLGQNESLGIILKKISYSQNTYCRKAPSFCPHRRKNAFLKEFFTLGRCTKIIAIFFNVLCGKAVKT